MPVVIDVSHAKIHEKAYYGFQRVFEDVPEQGTIYVSFRPISKKSHLVVTTSAEGKSRFKSYVNTTWSNDGTVGNIFNRYSNDSPESGVLIYYDGTPNVLGQQRFDTLILGGSGPQSSGVVSGDRVESVFDPGQEITVAVTNVSGQIKDIGLNFDWYEVYEND